MGKIKQGLRDLSLRKSIVLYIFLSALIALMLSAAVTAGCRSARQQIASAYARDSERYYLTNEAGERLGDGVLIRDASFAYTEDDERKLAVLNFLETVSFPLIFAACMLAAVFIFYRNKLKEPLRILDAASDRIAANDLDFTIERASGDEMGRLCASFEKMRASLAENYRVMWRQMEQRKRLNAAFAHDLRTPLTVLKGYAEMLQLAEDQPAAKETAATMAKHIDRLECYVDSMSSLQRLEDVAPNCSTVRLREFVGTLRQTAQVICEKGGKVCRFHTSIDREMAEIDVEMILTVLENLVANAVRYAQAEVLVELAEIASLLSLTVSDDGSGFSPESLEKASEPYYTGEPDKANHFGLGLHICRQLCESHGGSLKIGNAEQGGRVTATFRISNRS